MSEFFKEILIPVSEEEIDQCKETCANVLAIYADTQIRHVYLRMIAHDIQGEQF